MTCKTKHFYQPSVQAYKDGSMMICNRCLHARYMTDDEYFKYKDNFIMEESDYYDVLSHFMAEMNIDVDDEEKVINNFLDKRAKDIEEFKESVRDRINSRRSCMD